MVLRAVLNGTKMNQRRQNLTRRNETNQTLTKW